MRLGHATWTDVGEPLLVVPVGSCEQHGPHLPLDTDTVIAEALAAALVADRPDAVVAPSLGVTASGEHGDFPGTLSIGTEVLTRVIVELARSADWAAGVVLVNGHGGNADAVGRARQQLRSEGRDLLAWWPRLLAADLHAGRTETSLMLAIAPEHVVLDRAVDGPEPALPDLMRDGVRAHSASGVLGRASDATADEGRRCFDRLVEDLVAATDAWAAALRS